jgi:hypothetical protein
MASNVVTAPLVIVKNEDGSDRYLYQGAVVPEHIKGAELKRLKDEGMVGSEKELAETVEAADPTNPRTGPVADATKSDNK